MAMKINTIAFVLTCFVMLSASKATFPATSGRLADTVSPAFFKFMKSKARPRCYGRTFYTRGAFLQAANAFPFFTATVTKREVAAFFAHVTRETGNFCYIRERNYQSPSLIYCKKFTPFPCAPGRRYYGRGPLQIKGNNNYGAAGLALGLPLLQNPEMVAKDRVVAFKTALWYWITYGRPAFLLGFGNTIKAIDHGECGGQKPGAVQARIGHYKTYCKKLGVNPGLNLSC